MYAYQQQYPGIQPLGPYVPGSGGGMQTLPYQGPLPQGNLSQMPGYQTLSLNQGFPDMTQPLPQTLPGYSIGGNVPSSGFYGELGPGYIGGGYESYFGGGGSPYPYQGVDYLGGYQMPLPTEQMPLPGQQYQAPNSAMTPQWDPSLGYAGPQGFGQVPVPTASGQGTTSGTQNTTTGHHPSFNPSEAGTGLYGNVAPQTRLPDNGWMGFDPGPFNPGQYQAPPLAQLPQYEYADPYQGVNDDGFNGIDYGREALDQWSDQAGDTYKQGYDAAGDAFDFYRDKIPLWHDQYQTVLSEKGEDPYDLDGRYGRALLNDMTNQVTYQFNGADRGALDDFKARGMIGSPAASVGQAALGAARSRALSDAHNKGIVSLTDKSVGYQQDYNAELRNLLGLDMTADLKAGADLMRSVDSAAGDMARTKAGFGLDAERVDQGAYKTGLEGIRTNNETRQVGYQDSRTHRQDQITDQFNGYNWDKGVSDQNMAIGRYNVGNYLGLDENNRANEWQGHRINEDQLNRESGWWNNIGNFLFGAGKLGLENADTIGGWFDQGGNQPTNQTQAPQASQLTPASPYQGGSGGGMYSGSYSFDPYGNRDSQDGGGSFGLGWNGQKKKPIGLGGTSSTTTGGSTLRF